MTTEVLVILLLYLALAGIRLGFLGGSITNEFAGVAEEKSPVMLYFGVGVVALLILILLPSIEALLSR